MIEYFTSIDFLVLMIKIVVVFGGVMGALAYLTWLERKVMRPHPDAARTDARGPVWPASTAGRWLEIPLQRRRHPDATPTPFYTSPLRSWL